MPVAGVLQQLGHHWASPWLAGPQRLRIVEHPLKSAGFVNLLEDGLQIQAASGRSRIGERGHGEPENSGMPKLRTRDADSPRQANE